MLGSAPFDSAEQERVCSTRELLLLSLVYVSASQTDCISTASDALNPSHPPPSDVAGRPRATFPIVRKNELSSSGTLSTEDAILSIYDPMSAAISTSPQRITPVVPRWTRNEHALPSSTST
jgi:hypothetical protein